MGLFLLLAPGILAAGASVNTQIPSRQPPVAVFKPGEKHEIEVTYLGIPGLSVVLELMPLTDVNGRKSYHAQGRVATSAVVGLFYRVNDTVDSWFDYDGIFSHKLKLVQDESKIQRTSVETYDFAKGETQFTNKWKKTDGTSNDSDQKFAIPQFVQDSLSAAYFLRTLPLEKDATFKIPVVSEGNLIRVLVTVADLRPIEYDHKRVDAYLIRLSKLDADGKVMPGPENTVYISADARRKILGFNVWSRFGQVRATLKSYVEGS